MTVKCSCYCYRIAYFSILRGEQLANWAAKIYSLVEFWKAEIASEKTI